MEVSLNKFRNQVAAWMAIGHLVPALLSGGVVGRDRRLTEMEV
jgi:hypothetical protein